MVPNKRNRLNICPSGKIGFNQIFIISSGQIWTWHCSNGYSYCIFTRWVNRRNISQQTPFGWPMSDTFARQLAFLMNVVPTLQKLHYKKRTNIVKHCIIQGVLYYIYLLTSGHKYCLKYIKVDVGTMLVNHW